MAESENRPVVFVVTHSDDVASVVGQKVAGGGFSTVRVEPSPESVCTRIGESEAGVVVLDAIHKGTDVLTLAELLADVRPRAKVVIIGGTADLELVARAIVAKARHFLLDSAPAGEFVAAIATVVSGRQPGEDSVYGRVSCLVPVPTGRDGAFRNPAGRRFTAEEAIKQCDQLGITVDEIATHLQVPIGDAERVTKKARKAPKPVILPAGGVKPPSRRSVLISAALVAAVVALVTLLSREPRRPLITGVVTYQGQPVPAGVIRFTPQGASASSRGGAGGEIRDGRYAVKAGHGSAGGGYKVQIRGFTGVAKQVGPVVDPLGEELFSEVTRTTEIPCADFTFDVKCD